MTRLPLDQRDIVVGPLLSQDDPRVVMVAADHPLAGRRHVSVEDFADYPVRKPADVPELAEASCPSHTPSGRPIVPSDVEVNDISELHPARDIFLATVEQVLATHPQAAQRVGSGGALR